MTIVDMQDSFTPRKREQEGQLSLSMQGTSRFSQFMHMHVCFSGGGGAGGEYWLIWQAGKSMERHDPASLIDTGNGEIGGWMWVGGGGGLSALYCT